MRREGEAKPGRPPKSEPEKKPSKDTKETGEYVVCPLCAKPHPLKHSEKLGADYSNCRSWAPNQIIWFRETAGKEYLRKNKISKERVRQRRSDGCYIEVEDKTIKKLLDEIKEGM